MKKIILVIMICMCLASCSDNDRHKDGARMVKADTSFVSAFY